MECVLIDRILPIEGLDRKILFTLKEIQKSPNEVDINPSIPSHHYKEILYGTF